MDFACSVPRRSMFHGADCASYCLPNRMISSKLLCPAGLGSRFWDPMIDSKVRSASRLKRNVAHRGLLTLNAGFTGRFYGHLLPTKPKNAPLGFRLLCQRSDSVGDMDGNDRNLEFAESSDDREVTFSKEVKDTGEQDSAPSLEELRDLLNKATKELEVASLNSTMFEEKAQRISEVAIALKDEAASAWNDVNQILNVVQETVDEECVAKEAVQKATMALSLAEARLQVALESQEAEGYDPSDVSEESEARDGVKDKEEALLSAKNDIKECQENLASCEDQLRRLQIKKDELQKEVDKLNEAAERAQISALKAEEDVANIMVLAEQAVAFELEATQRVNDAEIALQRAEKSLFGSQTQETTQGKVLDGKTTVLDEDDVLSDMVDVSHQAERDLSVDGVSTDVVAGKVGQSSQQLTQSYESDNFSCSSSPWILSIFFEKQRRCRAVAVVKPPSLSSRRRRAVVEPSLEEE